MKFIYTLALLFTTYLGLAQDIIYKKDKTKIEAKVLTIGVNEIRYKRLDNMAGPDYLIQKSEIIMVYYENGTFENFAPPINNPFNSFQEVEKGSFFKNGFDTLYNSNVLSFHLADLFNYHFTLSFEKILTAGKLGLKFPIRINLEGEEFGSSIAYSGGVDLNFYPTGQGRLKYFLGPSIEVGKATNYYYDFYDSPFQITSKKEYLFVGGYLINGAVFQITKQLSLGTSLGIGFRNIENKNLFYSGYTKYDYSPKLNSKFELNLGLRF